MYLVNCIATSEVIISVLAVHSFVFVEEKKIFGVKYYMKCRFEVQDLHATEIFAYGRQLSKGENAPVEGLSLAYQRRRVQYAKLLASWGGFQLDAFRFAIHSVIFR